MPSPTIWFDLTSSMSYWGRRLAGMPRLELEIARELAADPQVRFVRFDTGAKRLVEVGHADLYRRLDQLSASELGSHTATGPGVATAAARPSKRGAAVGPLVASRRWGPALKALLAVRDDGRRVLADLVRLARAVPALLSRGSGSPCASTRFASGDVFCSVGLWDWPRSYEFLHAVKARRGIRLVSSVHDIIPVVRPQFRNLDVDRDRTLFRSLVEMADLVLYESESTASDVREFCRVEHLGQAPFHKVPMASSVTSTPPVAPAAAPEPGSFVLCVGTVEIRKNHHLLFDVWESLIEHRDPATIPQLVVAGGLGWLNTETVNRLQRTPGFDRHVLFVHDPTDAELAWLYRTCAFTVYPSLYEGWGLPVTESLDAGKVCITSDVSSMPEASEGLGVLLDPRDRVGWEREIIRLFDDTDSRRAMEDRIAAEHVVRTPNETAAAIRTGLMQLLGAPAS